MRIPSVVAFLLSLSTFTAAAAPPRVAAQEVPPAPAAPPAPAGASPAPLALAARPAAPAGGDWSLGAGVSFTGGSASLERRLAPASWLVVAVRGTLSRVESDAPPAGYTVWTQDGTTVELSAGLRQALTRPGAPVAVSVLALGEGSWLDAEERTVDGDTGDELRQRFRSWSAGGSVGVALERVLTGSLAVRISTPLVYARYGRSRTEVAGGGGGEPGVMAGDVLSAGVTLAPSLELRLAF